MDFTIWHISDTHFGHPNIIEYENRPFESTEQWTKIFIKYYQKTVGKQDKVFFHGDYSFYNKEITKNITSNLPGHKFLIMGNHDRHKSSKWFLEVGFRNVYEYPLFYDKDDIPILLSHEPKFNINIFNIHGHTHSSCIDSKLHYNASCENTNYKLIDHNEIIKTFI